MLVVVQGIQFFVASVANVYFLYGLKLDVYGN